MFKLVSIINQITPCVLFLLSAFVLFKNSNIFDFVLFGIPWSISLSISAYFVCANINWHLAYFHLICFYFRLILISVKKKMRFELFDSSFKNRMIIVNLSRLNQIILLINKFNQGFWSKYSAIMFATYNAIICAILYQTFFVDADLLTKSLLGHTLQFNISIFWCYIWSAIIVFREFKKIAKVLTQNYVNSNEDMTVIGKLKVSRNKFQANNQVIKI